MSFKCADALESGLADGAWLIRLLAQTRPWRTRAGHRPDREAGLTTFIAGCDVMERFFKEGIVGHALIAARKQAAT